MCMASACAPIFPVRSRVHRRHLVRPYPRQDFEWAGEIDYVGFRDLHSPFSSPPVSQGSNPMRDIRGSLRTYPTWQAQWGHGSDQDEFLCGSRSGSDPSVPSHDAAFGSKRTVEKPRARPIHQSAPSRVPGCPCSSNGGASRGRFAPFSPRPNEPVGSWLRPRTSVPIDWTFPEG